MPGKYKPLYQYLEHRYANTVVLTLATGTLPRGGSQHAEGESGTGRLDGGGSGPEEQPDALTVWRIRCEPPFACSLLRSS